MCAIAGIVSRTFAPRALVAMIAAQRHRGPDAEDLWVSSDGDAALGHDRLAILDLSEAGRQPMGSPDRRFQLVFNGEVYNHEELRRELEGWPFASRTDSEVVLAAWARWGPACLGRFLGMFAFALWDDREKTLFAARDRFGVKPLHYHEAADGAFLFASEVQALHAAGVPAEPDERAWASYLVHGLSDAGERTFWKDVKQLPPGTLLVRRAGKTEVRRWYDPGAAAGRTLDRRSDAEVLEELRALLLDAVRLRFRADVPVGVNLSGGLDSATLLGLVQALQGPESEVKAFTFATGDPLYDELPWVHAMLARTRHPSVVATLTPDEVPALAERIAAVEDGPFGGLPTLAYAKLFAAARAHGVIVTLDGQGMDEGWAGYDYYDRPLDPASAPTVQAVSGSATRAECVAPELAALAEPPAATRYFGDAMRDLQLRDLTRTKIPRALRYNDRASMRSSVELREPFLDHRVVELALRQPAARKVRGGVRKWLVRVLAKDLLPLGVVEAPKRPLQTPQREWLRGPLRGWARDRIEEGLARFPGWLRTHAVRDAFDRFARGEGDNGYFVWQWVSLGLLPNVRSAAHA